MFLNVKLSTTDTFFFDKVGLSKENILFANFHCQISMTKVSELSNISYFCCV